MIYSQCASLLVSSSSNEGNEENSIDYGKVATSVCQAKNSGVNFKPISINKAQKGFIPNAQDNIIIAGLKGISGVNNEFADKIIVNYFISYIPCITNNFCYSVNCYVQYNLDTT